ncbi:glycoside hydrolase family 3 C-terminal domain-containing protein [Paucilactobacillus suebicus]|uniref:Beta-glucosidase-related glycosidase n=1 Tax=Paucilactobacillus suebicus DSM 5007 = KCTC 3549 TaxID=1423807 RepID=A0A0R1W544_9LACO|nr:glycoside hydrolase family 3 C-terminal domain-containing protein [Paucilactobacillus suebicus]KRM12775.1 beta-glucosidase-related glycosidase [Paucilactobacillus suebicus DSM 5007 = KCTC 3549]
MEINQAFLNKLSLKEKASIVSGHNFWFTYDDSANGIKKIMMTDGPSGLRKQADSGDALGINDSVKAVSFPVSALTASSFDRPMMHQLGVELGIAARAENVSILLGPGVNIKRTPLAGRNFEYFSEDPTLAGELGTAYVQGVESQGVGVSVKHFAANNRENQRFTSSSDIDERSLREIYLLAFEKIVKNADPATLMCSYNKINGTLNSQNKRLLTDILRGEWGFDGFVMSDWGAVADHTAAIKAGLDLEMPGKGEESVQEIIDAVNDGSLDEHQLDNSVRRILATVKRWANKSDETVDYDKDRQHQFARQLAADSMVLLKNQNNVLPINEQESVLVIGQLAKSPRYQGSGSSHVNAYKVSVPLDELQGRANVSYEDGYQLEDVDPNEKLIDKAVSASKSADKIIIFAGFTEDEESEGYDKETIQLPDNQVALIQAIGKLNKPLIVVLQNGSAVEMPWINDADAILETYLAGEAVGEATADILLGDINPSGKLAETFPIQLSDNPTFNTFNKDRDHEIYHEGIFVGYRYYDANQRKVQFPFGYGLSYTNFEYQNLTTEVNGTHVTAKFNVINTGDRDGKEIAEVYVANQTSEIEKAPRELRDFAKVSLQAGETKSVSVELNERSFSWYNADLGKWQIDKGQYDIEIGASSRDLRLRESVEIKPVVNRTKRVTESTYVSDLKDRPELDKALSESGLGDILTAVENQSDSARLLENMPLRAGVMIGMDRNKIKEFIKLANENL